MSDAASLLAVMAAERDIERALHTYCRAIDRRDPELLRTVYHDDAIDDHGGAFIGGPDGYVTWVIDHLEHFVSTMHTLQNTLIDVDISSGVARSESYCVAHHVRPGSDDDLVMDVFGCRYVDRFERREAGVWKIAHRVVVAEWRLRQPMLSEADQPQGFYRGTRDRSDLVYATDLPDRTAPSSVT
ncbi:nuclear transport factor 2 family protein [Mycolicibacterium neoaurum]|uniref:nuclear transport factor 2 family protein n=1 Tax=Mycolicibacterium neoaurum TaxID=1795 RepID=UPI002671F6B9|nr:nuclear transport factor 2 family protein [Mycolicibacterium neoaurum]MDO3402779.1 nuclear transport factor 2 family protein [Mycolicibacterium neoaurum]